MPVSRAFLNILLNGSSVEEIWNNFKEIVFEGIERFVPQKIIRKTLDPEFYSKEVKRLKIKVRKAYNTRKLVEHHLGEMKRLSKLLLAEKNCTRDFFFSISTKQRRQMLA
jgi:hypothetical protein